MLYGLFLLLLTSWVLACLAAGAVFTFALYRVAPLLTANLQPLFESGDRRRARWLEYARVTGQTFVSVGRLEGPAAGLPTTNGMCRLDGVWLLDGEVRLAIDISDLPFAFTIDPLAETDASLDEPILSRITGDVRAAFSLLGVDGLREWNRLFKILGKHLVFSAPDRHSTIALLEEVVSAAQLVHREPDTTRVISAFESLTGTERQVAARALFKAPIPEEAWELAEGALNDSDRVVAFTAAVGLSDRPAIMRILLEEPLIPPQTRHPLFQIIPEEIAKDILPGLHGSLPNLLPWVRQFGSCPWAADSLRELLDPRIRPPDHASFWQYAFLIEGVLECLAPHLSPADAPRLRPFVDAEFGKAACVAAALLGTVGTVEDIPALSSVSRGNTPLSRAARRAIRAIQGRIGPVDQGALSIASEPEDAGALSIAGTHPPP